MKWNPEFTKRFLKSEKKLPKNIRLKVIQTVSLILVDPYRATQLVGNLKGLWKERVGKYRIIYIIKPKEKIIFFIDVGIRKKIYKNLRIEIF